MKSKLAVACAVALFVAPFATHADDADLIQSCIDTFVAQHFANRDVSVVVKDDTASSSALIAAGGTRTAELVATEKKTGKQLGSAKCSIKQGAEKGSKGSVSVGPLTNT